MNMSAQKVFDAAKTHLLKQNARSQDALGNCLYRAPGGLQCAVGCLLTDEEAEGIEGRPVYELDGEGLLPERLVPHVHLLGDLQVLHDNQEPDEWPSALRALVKTYGLQA